MATAPVSQRNEGGRKDEGEHTARESEKKEKLGDAERKGEAKRV